MTTIISAIDNAFNYSVGENGHQQLKWSKNLEESIHQFYFQLVRTSVKHCNVLTTKYNEILSTIFSKKSELSESQKMYYASIAFKLIAQTRDVVSGKGECSLTYMMIYCWARAYNLPDVHPKYHELCVSAAKNALKDILLSNTENEHPLGSWKDFKYFLNYFKTETKCDANDAMVCYAIGLINGQLKRDLVNYGNGQTEKISLAAKWAPRESSDKFGWITYNLAVDFYANEGWDKTAKTVDQQKRLKFKLLTKYRQLLSLLNNAIDTTQIKQCGNRWSEINFDKNVTSITISKQKSAFLNKSKKNKQCIDDPDRIKCASNFTDYIERCSSGKSEIKGKRVAIYDFVKDALRETDPLVKETINLQWENNSSQNVALENMIAMVDVSGSMECDNNTPMYNAIGLGLRIAEKSTIGKRVLTFSDSPDWVDLDRCNNFCEMVDKVSRSDWGMRTNFYAAFDKILQAYVNSNIDPDNTENMCLIILSDMQIDNAVSLQPDAMKTMFDIMENKFAYTGTRSKFNKPYKLPTVIFWNLRLTSGFPTTSYTKNTVMISGFSPIVLNVLVENGIQGLKDCNPWDMFLNIINNKRYNSFDETMTLLFSSLLN
jgi:hypothetical protein